MISESEQALKEKEIQHRIDNLKIPIKDRKPFERTELQKLQFQKCTEALKEKNRLKKEMKAAGALPTAAAVEENNQVGSSSSSKEEIAADESSDSDQVKKKRRVVFEKRSEESESEEEDLLKYIIKKKPKRQTRKRKVVILQDSSSDEEEVIVKRRPRTYTDHSYREREYSPPQQHETPTPAVPQRPLPSFRFV